MSPTRTLCARCLESFAPELGAGELCPACAELEAQRARGTGRAGALSIDPPEAVPATARDAVGLPGADPAPATPIDAVHRFLRRQITEARMWCDGRMPWFRIPLWAYLAWSFGSHLGSGQEYRSLFDGINLGIHELGHTIFRPLGTYMMVAGGTITQLAAPLATLFIFRRQKDFFGISVTLCWLATNLWGISVYCGDARALQLPLVAPGMGLMPGGDSSGAGGIIHDWNYLLGGPGLLKYDKILSGLLATGAVTMMVLGLALGAWLIVRMILSKDPPKLDFENL